ncbi:MAG: SDR family NAD(P)-dependent oxidoreductase [Nitrospinae bacterium]|nr:SDR family NAD(P)-dependent oxidoreductase [Nitrospinota bacterium]
MELKDKIFVITGAARGIGADAARRFSGQGADVAALDVNEEGLRSLEAESGGAVLGVRADISNPKGVEDAFDAVVARFGGVDALINCAVIRGNGPLAEVEEATVDLALGVGLKGGILCAKRAAAEMKKRGGGAIVNMSSFYARTPAKERVVYVAVKGGVEGLTRALAVELAEWNIRVNAIAAGPVLTRLRESQGEGDPDNLAERYRKSPMGRFGRVDEVLDAMEYLVTPRSSYMTGQVLVLDGGLTIV